MWELEKYIEDKRFLKWVFTPDLETENYYAKYLEIHPEEKEEILRVKKELTLLAVKNVSLKGERKEIIFKKIMNVRKERRSPLLFNIHFSRIARYAAVAIMFFAIGSLFMYEQKKSDLILPVEESLLVKSAPLNTTVFFADGSQREIFSTYTTIDFSCPGYLVVNTDSIEMGAITGSEGKNMIIVPYGKRASIKLYDHSVVGLNAGSRIVIPCGFSSEKRNAYLIGEAFFDIIKDSEHPFFVETSSGVIKVLGTSFFVSAYPDETEFTAYLQEGKISFRDSDHSLFTGWRELIPKEQLTLNKATKSISVKQGDELFFQLWKDGIVQFNNETAYQILKRVEQYFSITISVKDEEVGRLRINGKLDLNADRNEVFEYIEKITNGKITKINTSEFVLN